MYQKFWNFQGIHLLHSWEMKLAKDKLEKSWEVVFGDLNFPILCFHLECIILRSFLAKPRRSFLNVQSYLFHTKKTTAKFQLTEWTEVLCYMEKPFSLKTNRKSTESWVYICRRNVWLMYEVGMNSSVRWTATVEKKTIFNCIRATSWILSNQILNYHLIFNKSCDLINATRKTPQTIEYNKKHTPKEFLSIYCYLKLFNCGLLSGCIIQTFHKGHFWGVNFTDFKACSFFKDVDNILNVTLISL